MIRSNNPRIDIEALRARVAEEEGRMSEPAGSPRVSKLALELHLQAVEQALAAAEERSVPRTTWPENLQMFPFSVSRRLREFALRVLGLAMRDQQEVNAALDSFAARDACARSDAAHSAARGRSGVASVRLAIVTPWFGADLIGGAERLALDLSRALLREGVDVEVLTTCCRSFHDDWSANYYRPGTQKVDGVKVARFRVDPRDRVAFSRANSALLALRRDQFRRDLAPLPPAATDAFISQGIRSSALMRELRERAHEY